MGYYRRRYNSLPAAWERRVPVQAKEGLAGLRLGGDQGFTLIEALVALGILASVAVVLLGAIAGNYTAVSLVRERTTAESLARSQLEAVQDAPYEPSTPYYSPIVDLPSGYAITLEVVPLAAGPQKVKVIVSHGGKQVFTAEDYKIDR